MEYHVQPQSRSHGDANRDVHHTLVILLCISGQLSLSSTTTPISDLYYYAGTKTVSASLWWDTFVALCDDLGHAAASPSTAVSEALAERIKGHHAWLRGAVSMFGKSNGASRAVLDAGQVAVGEHRLAIKPDLKEATLHASKSLDLDEVQSYILVKRSSESTPTTRDADPKKLLHPHFPLWFQNVEQYRTALGQSRVHFQFRRDLR
ncbi:uncharacterized protein LOC125518486 [Triticum urartu]|uniref:uncharacterized protein LOC125518486 n=1 Tax=Triticum urartu TaxID=4572 RepID=UPI0020432208|nr:uncharacterized protein LOC125518486 [Triticum urartu]